LIAYIGIFCIIIIIIIIVVVVVVVVVVANVFSPVSSVAVFWYSRTQQIKAISPSTYQRSV